MTDPSLRMAYDALVTGDVDPLVALVDPNMVWRGRRRLLRRAWRPPS